MKRFPEANLRLAVLIGSLIVIVLAGYLVRQAVSDHIVAAFHWVDHTQQVRVALYELNSELNHLQAAALEARLNPADLAAVQRYSDSRSRYEPVIDHLRDLVSDSPEQQARVAALRERVHSRADLLDRGVQEREGNIGELTSALARLPTGIITDAILAREEHLIAERQQAADDSVRSGAWATAATALAQVLLLATVIWASERQLQRRIKAEAETRRAIDRARLIVETVREPIAVITADLGVMQGNQAFADFYGLSNPMRGNLADMPAWRDPALRQRLKDVVTMRRELWDFETEQEAGGIRRNVVVNARPMILPDTSDATALLTVSDMTVRKQAEEQVLELNRQLSGKVAQVSEVNRELEAFSYSVSHDLRAPLRHIAGFSDKLRSGLVDEGDDRMRHYCEVIAESARRMSTLIEDLLSYSRLGRHALRLQAVDMQSLVDDVRSTLTSAVEDRRITWRIAPLPVVIGDASMLRLVWQNLIDNAIKYSGAKDEAVIEVGVDENPAERVFWVRDNGAGFDMKYVDKLFGVFQRLHKASAFSGTGIGLASVRRIIARHDGRTWGEGSLDNGATIYFSLPRHETIS